MSPPVIIPPEIARTLAPRSAEGMAKSKGVTLKTAWLRVHENLSSYARYGKSALDVAFVNSFEDIHDSLKPRVKALHEFVARENAANAAKEGTEAQTQGPPSKEELTIELASALFNFFPMRAHDAIEALAGLPFAFEARLDSLRYEIQWTRAPGVVLAVSDNALSDLTLRTRLLHASLASPEMRENCRAMAERAWPTANFAQKATLAYTFFENEAWAHEVAREYVSDAARVKRLPVDVLYPIVRDLDLMREVISKRVAARALLEVVHTFGDAAFDLIADVFKAPRDEWDLKHAATALAIFDEPRAAELLVTNLGNAKVRPSIVDYSARFPKTARAALEPLAAVGKTRVAKLAKDLLASIDRTTASAEETPSLLAEAEASEDELPWILVKPPWLDRKKSKKAKPPSDETPQEQQVLEILEREEHVRLSPDIVRMAEEVLDPSTPTFKYDFAVDGVHASLVKGEGPEQRHMDDESLLEHWTANASFNQSGPFGSTFEAVVYVMHRFGTRAIPGLIRFFGREARGHRGNRSFILGVDTPKLAPIMATRITEESRGHWDMTWGPIARRWIKTHPETAVIGLVPSALVGDSARRAGGNAGNASERALRMLRDQEGVDVLALAKPYGEEVCARLATLLSWDTRYDLPARLPKLPTIYRPESLTRPLLKNGKRLPLATLTHLGMMLAITDKRFPYAGIKDVKDACDPRSLAEFAWDLAKSWEMAGAKKPTGWMVESLIHFADDEVVRRTTPAMRSLAIGDVLQMIGTDAAVMELVTIGARAAAGNSGYSSWGFNAVNHRIEQIAIERGGFANGGELEESVLPVREIDYKGFELDYGPRKFQVAFDERLDAFIVGVAGLPPMRKTDDKLKVEAAKLVWQDLKEEVSAVVARRLAYLEQAMSRGTSWSFAEFKRRYIDHPLLRHLGRVLLWEQNGKRFRITEDAAFADVDDHELALDTSATAPPIMLAHVARFEDPEEAKRWVQIFFDYHLVQPFLQVGRTTRPIPKELLTTREFVRPAPSGLTKEAFQARFAERGYRPASGVLAKTLSRGMATLTHESGATTNTFTLKFLPPWIDFNPVDMAECLADIES